MNEQTNSSLAERFSSDERLTRLITKAVRDAVLDHKRAGNPIAVWRDGRVVIIPPEEIQMPEEND